jgi:glycogen debranching enzyme
VRIEFGSQICASLVSGSTREWLVPDGLGGYAMGTVNGLRTRRYHGLLMVPGQTPATRHLALAALDPVLNGIRLSTHEWASGAISPAGHVYLERFELVNGLPRWRWRVGQTVIERELAMWHGHSCVGVVHRLLAGGPAEVTLEALCAWRDQHGEQHEVTGVTDNYELRGPNWTPDGTWLAGVHYRMEAERGYQPNENLLLAGRFQQTLTAPGDTLEVTAWAGELSPPPARDIITLAHERNSRFAPLELAADAFVVKGPDVVAGYPWFGAWSRDTMTSYEGLFLCTRRFEEGRELLRGYAATLSEGMLANTADGGTVGYNTADATLWFLHAIDRHRVLAGDEDLWHELRPAMDAVVEAHLRGTRYGIKADDDGLVTQGAEGEALTWMDARVGGVPVTPRRGKAVEINALWCNALAALGHPLRERAVASFRQTFAGIRDTETDGSLRPNQLLAYSLPYAPMEPDPVVLGRLGDALLTPLGLRSLDPADQGYRANHSGSLRERDLAYHQGTVWPWLIGPYVSACRKAGVPTENLLAGLLAHLLDYGLTSVSETLDAEAPHHATGCPFQAWSVAELLRSHML